MTTPSKPGINALRHARVIARKRERTTPPSVAHAESTIVSTTASIKAADGSPAPDAFTRGQGGVSLHHVGVPLLLLLSHREQGDAGASDAEDGLAEGSSQVRELDQVLRADLGVGAHVQEEHHAAVAGDGHLRREGGSVHALQPLHGE